MNAQGPPRQIPGFYYDAATKRYFKIAHASTVSGSAAAQHTFSNVKKKRRIDTTAARDAAVRQPLGERRLFTGRSGHDWRRRLLRPLLSRSLGHDSRRDLAFGAITLGCPAEIPAHDGRQRDTRSTYDSADSPSSSSTFRPCAGAVPARMAVDWRAGDVIRHDHALYSVDDAGDVGDAAQELGRDILRDSFEQGVRQMASVWHPIAGLQVASTPDTEWFRRCSHFETRTVRSSGSESASTTVVRARYTSVVCPRDDQSFVFGGALDDVSRVDQDSFLTSAGAALSNANRRQKGIVHWQDEGQSWRTTLVDAPVTALAALGSGLTAVGSRDGTVGLFDTRVGGTTSSRSPTRLFHHGATICALSSPDWHTGQTNRALLSGPMPASKAASRGARTMAHLLVCKSLGDELKLWDLRHTRRPVVTYRHYKNRGDPTNNGLAFHTLGASAPSPIGAQDTTDLSHDTGSFRRFGPSVGRDDPKTSSGITSWLADGRRDVILTEVAKSRALGVHSMDGEAYVELPLPQYVADSDFSTMDALDARSRAQESNRLTHQPVHDICVSFGTVYTAHARIIQAWAL